MNARALALHGVRLDDLDDAAVWFALVHTILIDGMAAGVWAASERYDEAVKWGTIRRPDRVAWGEPDAPFIVDPW